MLVRYEYEVLSSVALNGIKKVDGDILVTLKRIEREIVEDDLEKYLDLLEAKGLVELYEAKFLIKVNEWIDFFINELQKKFNENEIDIECIKELCNGEYYINFTSNGAQKKFLVITAGRQSHISYDNLIYLCRPNLYDDEIFWLDLLNNINLIEQFKEYLVNEFNYKNKNSYRYINIFSGLDDKYITEVFAITIKSYFKNKKYKFRYIIDDNNSVVKSVKDIEKMPYYGVELTGEILWIIKNDSRIEFLSVKNNKLTYSASNESIILDLQEKITNKLNRFKMLMLFKENNILENSIEIAGKGSVLFIPITIIISIITLLKINVSMETLANYKFVLWVLIFILAIIQIIIGKVVIYPAIKLSTFNWKIKKSIKERWLILDRLYRRELR